jgi:hypothetical protein
MKNHSLSQEESKKDLVIIGKCLGVQTIDNLLSTDDEQWKSRGDFFSYFSIILEVKLHSHTSKTNAQCSNHFKQNFKNIERKTFHSAEEKVRRILLS